MLKLLASPYQRSHLKIIPVQKMVTFYAYKKIAENSNTPIRRRKKRWEKTHAEKTHAGYDGKNLRIYIFI